MRYQRGFGKLVAVLANEFFVLDYVFDDGKGFYGATGTRLVPVWREDYEERTSTEALMERYEEIWRADAATPNGTTDGLEEWVENMTLYHDPEDEFDLAYGELWPQFRDILGEDEHEVPVFEVVSCGRCLDDLIGLDESGLDTEIGDRIVDAGLLDLIHVYEGKALQQTA